MESSKDREVVDCPTCQRQRWIDADCPHCGNSAVTCLKKHLSELKVDLDAAVRSHQKMNSLIDAECGNCGRSLPPDGDCFGCSYDLSLGEIGSLQRQLGELERLLRRWRNCPNTPDVIRDTDAFFADRKEGKP